MKRFPLYVDISNDKIGVVGGGSVALRRVTTLLSFCSDITVIAPVFHEELLVYERLGKITLIQVELNETLDLLRQYSMLLAATNDRFVNHLVYLKGKEWKIKVNICDCQEECDFFFPSIIEEDIDNNHIVASITANGGNHKLVRKLAAKIRETIKQE